MPLATVSGACGIGLAVAGNALLRHFLPPDFAVHRLGQTHIDSQVLGVAVLITLLTGVGFRHSSRGRALQERSCAVRPASPLRHSFQFRKV